MTPKQIAVALLAVSIGAFVMQFATAQNRTAVKSTYDNHRAIRYRFTALPDGGVATTDLLQEAADLCRASGRAVQSAETRFYASGTPSVNAIKALMATEATDCAALDVLRSSVDQAKAIFDGSRAAYRCAYLRACPDGGS